MPKFADTTEGLIMAEDKKESKENFVPAPDGGGGGPKGPLLTIILVLNLALMGGLGFMQFKMHKKKKYFCGSERFHFFLFRDVCRNQKNI